MGTWLRQGARVAALVAVSLTPMLTGWGSDAATSPAAGQSDTVPSPVVVDHRDTLV